MEIIRAAEEEGAVLKILGGLAIAKLAPSGSSHPSLKRVYKDIDFISDGVRIRLKRGGRHGSESVSERGVHHPRTYSNSSGI